MRAFVVLLLLALAGGAVYVNMTKPKDLDELPAVNPYPFLKEGKWARFAFKDLNLMIPVEYSKKLDNGRQWILYGPEHNGFRSNIQMLQRKWHKDAEAWYAQERGFHDNPIRRERIIDEGPARIAGGPARYIVWETQHTSADGVTRTFSTIEWCWVKGGKAYWVRGQAESKTFMTGHRLLFQNMARTVQFN